MSRPFFSYTALMSKPRWPSGITVQPAFCIARDDNPQASDFVEDLADRFADEVRRGDALAGALGEAATQERIDRAVARRRRLVGDDRVQRLDRRVAPESA